MCQEKLGQDPGIVAIDSFGRKGLENVPIKEKCHRNVYNSLKFRDCFFVTRLSALIWNCFHIIYVQQIPPTFLKSNIDQGEPSGLSKSEFFSCRPE